MRVFASVSAAALLSASCPALALAQIQSQTAPAATADQLDEVVVTAERRESRLQETPVAVSAFSQQDLERRLVRQTENLSDTVPGLYINKISASPSALTISLRGAAEQTGGLVTSESPVALYVDDVYQARLSSANAELADIVRVEVLRGPQGTLYGRNSMTGAVKFITRRPTEDLYAKTDLDVGSRGLLSLRGSFAGPLPGDIAAIGLSAFHSERDGWQRDTFDGSKRGARDAYGVRLSLASLSGSPIDWLFTASTTRDENDGISAVPVDPVTYAPLAGGFSNTRTPTPGLGDTRQTQAALTLSHDLGWATLRSVTAYGEVEDDWALDFSGGFFNGSAIVPGFVRTSHADQDQVTQEFQLLGDAFDGRLEWIGGLFYFKEEASQRLIDVFGVGVFGPFPVALLPTSFDTESESLAAYGQIKFDLTDALTLTAGLRYTDDDKTFDGSIQNGLAAFPPTSASVSTRGSWTATTPKLTLDYKAAEHVLFYASVAKGYRAGGFNGLAVANPAVFGATYDPEHAWNYEVGAKAELFDRRLRVNTALYQNQLKDLQQNVQIGGGSTQTENAADATLNGLEVESTWVINASIQAFANVSVIHDEYDRVNPASIVAVSGAKRLPLVAREQVSVGVNWTGEAVFGDLTPSVSADYSYRSSRFAEAANDPIGAIPSVQRVNLSAALESPQGWTARIWARNLLDEDAYYSALALIPGLITGRYAEEPRTVGLTLSYKPNL